MDLKDSISIEDLSAVAEEGQTTNIGNEYSFTRNKPLAVSTVAREERNQRYKQKDDDIKSGSFLNNNSLSTPPGGGRNQSIHQLRLSFSALDQSNPRPIEVTGSKSDQILPKQDENLISWGQPPYGIGSDFDTSRKSSLGLIQVDAMSDLTGSMFNLDIPGMEKSKAGNRSVQGSSSNYSKTNSLHGSSHGTSLGNSQHQGSTSDSHSTLKTAFFRHDVETVKKKPSDKTAPAPEGPVRQSLVFKQMFSGQQDGDVTLPEVNLDNEELDQLDDDFSDFDETGIESVDEGFKDLPQEKEALDPIYLKAMERVSTDNTENTQLFPSLSKVTLFDDIGSNDDLRNVEGKQTTQSSEIDTEDELEMARQSMGLEREIGAGQCSDNRASIPRPGVEGTSQQEMTGNPLSIAMRQSAEGDVVTSPIPGDGGGGGDGSSGSESEDVRQSTDAKNFLDAFRSNFRPVIPAPSASLDIEEQRVKPMGDDLLTEKGIDRYSTYQGNNLENESLLQSRYLAPTPMLNASDSASQLQWSVDKSLFTEELSHQSLKDAGNRLEASGFNAEDVLDTEENDNPFGDVRNSFGSFGASPTGKLDLTPPGDITLEPPMSPRTSVDSKSHRGSSPRFAEEPKLSLQSPQPSQSVRSSSHKYHHVVQQEEKRGIDLNFVSSLATEAKEQKALVNEMVAQGNLGVNFTVNEDFMPIDKAKELLDIDEKEFEKENIFREDENMETDVFPDSDMWTNKSKMTIPADDICRISVGQFIKSRSGALGSLDGEGPRPDFGMTVKTPPSNRRPFPLLETTNNNTLIETSNESDQTSSIIYDDGTLHKSDISRFMQSVSMSKDPKEIAKMVMTMSNKPLAKDKTSKLPVRKGSNLKARDKLYSDHMTLSDLTPYQSPTLNKNDKESKRDLFNMFSYENKTNPDGEESDTEASKNGLSTPPKSSNNIFDGYSPRLSMCRLVKSTEFPRSDEVNESLDKFGGEGDNIQNYVSRSYQGEEVSSIEVPLTLQNNEIKQLYSDGISIERSSRGSSSGYAGHHIPDGTEYSKSSEFHQGLLRQELEGTEDIQLVDSRGFDAISNRNFAPEQTYQDKQSSNKRHSDFDPRKHHAFLKAQANKHKHSHSAENLTLTSVKTSSYLENMHESSKMLTSTLPTHSDYVSPNQIKSPINSRNYPDHQPFSHTMPESLHGQSQTSDYMRALQNRQSSSENSYHQNVVDSIVQNATQSSKTSSPNNSASIDKEYHAMTNQRSQINNIPESQRSQSKIVDDLLMPPPPVPSFRHNLLPRTQPPERPTLLTSESMISKDFAKEYLQREDPGRLVSRDIHPRPLPYQNGRDSMFSHRESDIPLPTHHDWHGDDISISNRLPVYQSTPYNNRVDMTIITPSSMHTMMSTGMMTELQAENLTVMENDVPETRTPPRAKLSAVTAPSVLKFADVCCVGISTETTLTLNNPTNSWLECFLQLQDWTIDGREICFLNYLPFEMKKKVIIEPHTSENVTVMFIPKIAGAYVGQLNVSSGLFLQDNTVHIEKIPTVVTLQAIAEEPQIQVRTEGYNKCMNFGHIAWGSCKEMSLQIINRGQATIPVRLSISLSHGSWHSFSFDTKLADVSVISRSSRPQSAAIGRTVIPVCVPGRKADSDPTVYDIKVYCRPPEKQCGRAMAQYPPTEMFARIDVEVDTPSHLPLISTIELKAVVGVAKLHLSRQLQVLQFKTANNQPVNQKFNLKNAGNINMELLLGVVDYQEYFTVDPSQLTIPAGHESQITVSFLPVKSLTVESFETVLLMSIMPHGPDYDLPIRAEIKKEPIHVLKPHGPVLLGDRQFLDFGGIPVGKSVIKRYTLKNRLQNQLKLSLEIRSDTDSFQLVWNDRRSYTREVMINSGEKFVVNMEYRPSAVRQHHGKLVVKPEGLSVKYSIPLEGYGGTSILMIEGTSVIQGDSLSDLKYWLNFTGIESNKCQIQKIVIRNVGPRASYVKAVSFTDPRCKNLIKPPKVLIEPNEFIVKEQSSKCVTIVFNPSERECALCTDGREIVAVVAFLFGDEISRQRMRRVAHLNQSGRRVPQSLCDDNVLYSINFNTQYIDEDCVTELPAAITDVGPSKDIDLFYKNMSKVSVTLVASAVQSGVYKHSNLAATMQNGGSVATSRGIPNGNICSTVPADYLASHLGNGSLTSDLPPRNLPSSMPVRNQAAIVHTSPFRTPDIHMVDMSVIPVKDSVRESVSSTVAGLVTGPVFTRSLLKDDDKSDWTIKPDQLILHAPTQRDDRPDVSKFQIINFLNRELTFKMSWLTQWVKITPEIVTVTPKSTTSVCISPSASVLQNMETLPWSGTVHITCNDQYKVLNVQIRKDVTVGDGVNKNLVPLFKQASAAPSISIPPDIDSQGQALQTSTTQVNFSPTKVGDMSETYIDLINVSSETLRWTISSFAPAYVKGADYSKDVFRATYKVFVFSEKFGHLEGNQKMQICMQFMPRSKGIFSQFWEIQSRGSLANNVRVELKGEGVDEEPKKPKEPEVKRRSEALFTLENEEMTHEFSPCDIGHVQIIKVQLKNRSSAPQTVEVIPPQPPFVVKHSSFIVRPKSFIRFPIEFRPNAYGAYNGLIIFKPNIDSSVSCKVHGVCKKM